MTKTPEPEDIESTTGQQPAEPDDRLSKARRFARPRVIAEGWSDADIDRIIDEERDAVRPNR